MTLRANAVRAPDIVRTNFCGSCRSARELDTSGVQGLI